MRLDPMATTEPPGTIVLVTVNHGGWAHCGEMSHLSGHPFPVQVSSAPCTLASAEIRSRHGSVLTRSTCASEVLPR
jgi:hypothetical protein